MASAGGRLESPSPRIRGNSSESSLPLGGPKLDPDQQELKATVEDVKGPVQSGSNLNVEAGYVFLPISLKALSGSLAATF